MGCLQEVAVCSLICESHRNGQHLDSRTKMEVQVGGVVDRLFVLFGAADVEQAGSQTEGSERTTVRPAGGAPERLSGFVPRLEIGEAAPLPCGRSRCTAGRNFSLRPLHGCKLIACFIYLFIYYLFFIHCSFNPKFKQFLKIIFMFKLGLMPLCEERNTVDITYGKAKC